MKKSELSLMNSHGMRRHVNTWPGLKREMRTRFGSKSVEEYHKDMEVALSSTNVLESNEATMGRFVHGLNQDILDMVEMSHCSTMNNLVQ
ncbi:hypothetical protein CR513_12914, partial [Mucuna pruriens]